MKTLKLRVFELLGNSLSSREQANLLYNRIKNCPGQEVIVDFSKVNFISRSFADQFYKDFLELNKVMKITAINGSQIVSDMLNAVSQTQHGKNRKTVAYKIQSFSNKKQLKEYLHSIE